MLLSCLTVLLVIAPSETIWPAFRGHGDSHSRSADLPVGWSRDRHVAWRVALPGFGQSSPLVWRDRVVVTTMEGRMKERPLVLCFDLNSGEEKWRRAFRSSQPVEATNYVSRSAPTPAMDADRIYAFFESGDLVTLDHSGELLWQRSLTTDYGLFQGNHGVGSSLALTDAGVIVCVAHDGPSYLAALDKTDGQNLWKQDRPAAVGWSSPIVSGSSIFLSGAGAVEELDARSGEPLWRVGGLDGNLVPSPTVTDALVVVGANDAGSNLAVRRGGRGDVTETHVAWRAAGATSSFASPLVHRDVVYFVNRSGVVQSCDAATGNELWQYRLGGSCWASPVAAGDLVYFFTTTGLTVVLKAGPKLDVVARNELDVAGQVVGVAAVDGHWLVRTPTELICIAAAGPPE